MSKPTLYQIDPDKWAEHFEQDLDDLAWYVEHGVLVPAKPAIVAIDQYGHVRNWGGLTGPKEGFYQIVRIEGAGIGGDDE